MYEDDMIIQECATQLRVGVQGGDRLSCRRRRENPILKPRLVGNVYNIVPVEHLGAGGAKSRTGFCLLPHVLNSSPYDCSVCALTY